jgi:hypothetical protein
MNAESAPAQGLLPLKLKHTLRVITQADRENRLAPAPPAAKPAPSQGLIKISIPQRPPAPEPAAGQDRGQDRERKLLLFQQELLVLLGQVQLARIIYRSLV